MGACGRLLLWIGLVLGIGLGGASTARACKPFRSSPAGLTPPVALDPAIHVASATLDLDCRVVGRNGLDPGNLRCSLHSVQRLHNRSDQPVETVAITTLGPWMRGISWPSKIPPMRVRLDGKSVARPATLDEHQRWRARFGLEALRQGESDDLELSAVDLELEPDQSAQLELRAELTTGLSVDGCMTPAIHTRHRLVSPDDTWAVLEVVRPYGTAPVPYEITVQMPLGWTLDSHSLVSPRRAHRVRGAGAGRKRYELSTATPEHFSVTVQRRPLFVRGGPLVGVGLDLGEGVRPRLRAGWEVATIVPFWMQAVALESDLRSVTLVPSTEIASANTWLVFPSFGVGVGAPVQVWPRARAGVRTQLSIHWPFVGLLGTLDVFPVPRRRPDLRGGVVVQVGF